MEKTFAYGALFGWLLSILTLFIQNYLQKRERIVNLKSGIREELSEIERFLIINVFQLSGPVGEHDRDALSWCLKKLKQRIYTATEEEVIEIIENRLEKTDEQLKKINDTEQNKKSYYLKLINTFYLDSQIDKLPLLDQRLQQAIIRANLRIKKYNEEIEQSRFYFKLSFDSSLSETNRKIEEGNLFRCYKNLYIQSGIIIEDIGTVIRLTQPFM
jgi:hypothetical protein